MSRTTAASRDERLNTPFLRAIGGLAIAAFELRMLAPAAGEAPEQNQRAWGEFAQHLLANADAVLSGAAGSSFPGNTIAIQLDGVQLAIEPEYVERITERMRRHTRIGHALGLGASEELLTA